MKGYKNLYPKICSYKNLERAFMKARKGKTSRGYVIEFEINIRENLLQLKRELENFAYRPLPLKKFIVHDPKTRVIRKSEFRDRIVHHALVNVLEPIYEKVFIFDNYANRVGKGTLAALKRFDGLKRKVSENGGLVKDAIEANAVKGYVLKGDIKQYFDSVDHEILIRILKEKIKDERIIWLVEIILKNFDNKEKGMPLGNMTSQFFANVYLNELDYFVKHKLHMKYYLRYVDDFIILHEDKGVLENCKGQIKKYLTNLKLELHSDKSKVYSMYKGVEFLGFRSFYHYRLLRKRNVNLFRRKIVRLLAKFEKGLVGEDKISETVDGWFAYARWGNTYKLRRSIARNLEKGFKNG